EREASVEISGRPDGVVRNAKLPRFHLSQRRSAGIGRGSARRFFRPAGDGQDEVDGADARRTDMPFRAPDAHVFPPRLSRVSKGKSLENLTTGPLSPDPVPPSTLRWVSAGRRVARATRRRRPGRSRGAPNRFPPLRPLRPPRA